MSSFITKILKLRYDPGSTRKLPADFSVFQNRLRNSQTPVYLIRNDPCLLPAATYALGFLKLYGLLMNDGLLETYANKANNIMKHKIPYQRASDSWTRIIQPSLLNAWLHDHCRIYTRINPRYQMEFGRNFFSHPF